MEPLWSGGHEMLDSTINQYIVTSCMVKETNECVNVYFEWEITLHKSWATMLHNVINNMFQKKALGTSCAYLFLGVFPPDV